MRPRQPIVLPRELPTLAAAADAAGRALAAVIAADFAYDGVDTCAGDSMCETSCPVRIDTGALVKELRAAAHPARTRGAARFLARHFRVAAHLARSGLRAATLLRAVPLGDRVLGAVTGALHRAAPSVVADVLPGLALPRPAPSLPAADAAPGARSVVYFPSCLTRIIGPQPGEAMVPPARAAIEALRWAGFAVRYPEATRGLCCGMPFGSKGFPEAAREAAGKTAEALWMASRAGRDPVITDASPCAGTLNDLATTALRESGRTLSVFDFPSFCARLALPGRPSAPRRRGVAVLHPTCSLVRSGGLPDLVQVAEAHAERVVVPESAECCGFAGDRGFLVPELTERPPRAAAAPGR